MEHAYSVWFAIGTSDFGERQVLHSPGGDILLYVVNGPCSRSSVHQRGLGICPQSILDFVAKSYACFSNSGIVETLAQKLRHEELDNGVMTMTHAYGGGPRFGSSGAHGHTEVDRRRQAMVDGDSTMPLRDLHRPPVIDASV